MPPGERLPEHHADRPDVGRAGGVVAREALGRDVRERPGHVALRGERLGLGHAGEPEVEEPGASPSPSASRTFEGLTSRWRIPARVRMREALADLCAGLDRVGVVELAGAQRLAERAARDELVGDVDVARIAGECVRAQAARVAQLRGRRGLALGARGGLALAGDDLQGDVEPRLLVAGEPHRPRAAAPERAQRAGSGRDEPGRLRAREQRSTSVRTGWRPAGYFLSGRTPEYSWRPRT